MKPCLSCGRVSTEALCGHCTGLVPEALVTLARRRGGPGLLALARYIDGLRAELGGHR